MDRIEMKTSIGGFDRSDRDDLNSNLIELFLRTLTNANDIGGLVTTVLSKVSKTPLTKSMVEDTVLSELDILNYSFFVNKGATAGVTVTLPAFSYRIEKTFIIEEAFIMEFIPPTGELFDLNGVDLDAGDTIDSDDAVGCKMTVTRMQKANGDWFWSFDTVRGTWTDAGTGTLNLA